jgi:hypothetical protein
VAFIRTTGVHMATIEIKVPGSAIEVHVEMPLLHMSWPSAFNAVVQFEEHKYTNDPSWNVVTPENLLLRAQGQASPEDTKTMDRLLAYAPMHTCKTVEDLQGLVSSAYLKGGDDCAHLTRLLPLRMQNALSAQKTPQAVPFTRENLLLGKLNF